MVLRFNFVVNLEEISLEDHLWDKLFKIIGDYYPNELVKFLFPDKEIQLCGKYEQEKVVIESQTADINFWVEEQGIVKLLNIEPYSSWRGWIPSRVFTRNGIITKALNYEYQVISVVLLLEKGSYQGCYEVSLGNQINHFLFPIVSFQDIEGILKKYRFLAPFVVKVDISYQDRVINIVRDDKLLKAITVLILSRLLKLSQKEVLAMIGSQLEEFRQALLEVPIMQELWKEEAEKTKKTIAINMLKEGLDVALIAKITSLSLEEIAKIKLE